MSQTDARIRDFVEARAQPTVVRLQDLGSEQAEWLSQCFVLTAEVRGHLEVLSRLFAGRRGSGVFLLGQYGAGKSHLLAYLAQQVSLGRLLPDPPDLVPISLVNFSANNRLEDIVCAALGIAAETGDRRPRWDALLARHPKGLVLLVDELSEFLRAKPDPQTFSEDIRFLQFLGEWVQDQPCWLIAAMQEGIEHTGELEYDLYRKIKDRYPLRLLLTPVHIKELIAEGILVKKPGYEAAIERLLLRLRELYGEAGLDVETLRAIYPLHPATLTLLEEVRDRFSKARGVVDFTVTQLRGDSSRRIAPFLDRPWGELITPDAIVDHFRDLLELQPEFLALAQQVFPWYRRHLEELFERAALRELAERLLKLLVLTHLSPARDGLTAKQAASWLLFGASTIQPERNEQIIARALSVLVERGRYVTIRNGRYALDLREDTRAILDRLLVREVAGLKGQHPLVQETLLSLLPADSFNPLALPRETWLHRRLLWYFHERGYCVWLGDGSPPAPPEGVALCLRLPWGERGPTPGVYTVQPARVHVSEELVEVAALARLKDRPGSAELSERLEALIKARIPLVSQILRSAWTEACLITPDGASEPLARIDTKTTLADWLQGLALRVLRRSYPGFERYAPAQGPLPKEAWLRFMRFAAREDIGAEEADDYVKLIREAYLAPMGLLRRKGRAYVTTANLERHELVRLVASLLDHNPTPKTVHESLAQPIYGLVPDQINLLLVFLLLQGEIDILKDRKSYRETFETLPNPLLYDRIIPAHALNAEQLKALETLCQGLGIRTPAHWSVLTQRRCAGQLADALRAQAERLQPLHKQLQGSEQGKRLAERLAAHIERCGALDKGAHALQGLEQFLYEIGSVAGFLDQAREYEALPHRLQQLLGETQRYLHLFRHPAVVRAAQRAGEFEPGAPPGLDEPQQVEHWLRQAEHAYRLYKESYREGHERWWRGQREHPLWQWCPPRLAASRHLGMGDLLSELEQCRREATRLACSALVDLDYQPQCSCGFDGDTAPIAAQLQRCEHLRTAIESQLRLFFQQDTVKARLRDWQREGIEPNSGTLSYLEGQDPYPEVRDVASLDRYLSGLELTAELDLAPVVELLTKRVWERKSLLAAIEEELTRQGEKRLRFSGDLGEKVPPALYEWCAEQCLRYGVPLPRGLGRAALDSITQCLRSEWAGRDAVEHLSALGLDEAGETKLLRWLIDGHIPVPELADPKDPLLAAVAMLLRPATPANAAELARNAHAAYLAHAKVHRIGGERWLACMNGLAETTLSGLPPLVEVLKAHSIAQWVLIDCLGSPLVPALEPVLLGLLSMWRHRPAHYAELSQGSSTDSCYRELLGADITHSFKKIDAIDRLIHAERGSFDELLTLAKAELEIAFKRLLPQLDPEQALLVFTDHGFRLSPDGRRYQHGGHSTLERVVPVWVWEPRSVERVG